MFIDVPVPGLRVPGQQQVVPVPRPGVRVPGEISVTVPVPREPVPVTITVPRPGVRVPGTGGGVSNEPSSSPSTVNRLRVPLTL